ncbi:hypothetical protein ACTZVX_27515, partial [Klebsiella pneumoniae]
PLWRPQTAGPPEHFVVFGRKIPRTPLGYNRDTHKAHAVGLSGRVVPFKHQLCTSFKDPLINPVNK